jgi:hypothetical protein
MKLKRRDEKEETNEEKRSKNYRKEKPKKSMAYVRTGA